MGVGDGGDGAASGQGAEKAQEEVEAAEDVLGLDEDDFHLVEDENLEEISHEHFVKFTVGSGHASQVQSSAIVISGMLSAACRENEGVRKGRKQLVIPADPSLNAATIPALVKFMEYHAAEHSADEVEEFDALLLRQHCRGPEGLLGLAVAAELFGIPSLVALVTKVVVMCLEKAESPEEARKGLAIASDFSAAEEERIDAESHARDEKADDVSLSFVLNSREELQKMAEEADRRSLWQSGGLSDATAFDTDADEQEGEEPEAPPNSLLYDLPRRQSRVFLPASASDNCMSTTCDKSLGRLKKHCRACGRLFCAECCDKSVNLPDNAHAVHSLPMTSYANGWFTRFWDMVTPGKVRKVCDRCYAEYEERTRLSICTRGLALLALPLPFYFRTAHICRAWRRSSLFVLQWAREIQYLLPTQPLPTQTHRQFLLHNMSFFVGHSQWLLQIAKAIDWADDEQAVAFTALLGAEKQSNCWNRLCTRVCNERMSPVEAIQLLEIPYLPVRRYATSCLAETSDEQLTSFLPLLLRQLRYEQRPLASTSGHDEYPLWSFLSNRALSSVILLNDLLWGLHVCHEETPHMQYDLLSDRLLVAATAKQMASSVDDYLRSKHFVRILDDAVTDTEAGVEQLRAALAALCSREAPMRSPVCPNLYIIGFDVERLVIKNSATKPVVLPCLCVPAPVHAEELAAPRQPAPMNAKVQRVNIMFKKDDVRQDYVALNLVRLIDRQLVKEAEEQEELTVPLVTYRVLPVGVAKGFVEFVDDAETLYSLEQKETNGILYYLLNNNGNSLPEAFIQSTAGYSVISYLLGVGDRHADNVMVTKDGRFFHIDFGYVLGNDPKPLMPPIRLSPQTITAMKGEKSPDLHRFLEKTVAIYLALRRYPYLFLNMLRLLVPDKEIRSVEYELTKRFLIGFQETEAGNTFRSIVKESCNSTPQYLNDIVHSLARQEYLSSIVSLQDSISVFKEYLSPT